MKWPREITDGPGPYVVAGVLTVLIHLGLGAGGMAAADRWGHGNEPTPPIMVEIVPIERKPEPKKEEPKKEEPKKEEPKPEVPLPKTEPPKVRKVSHEAPPPPKADEPPKTPPKPDEPPPLLEVPMASTTTGPSNVTVNASEEGNLKGDPNGVHGGRGKPGPRPGVPTGDPRGIPNGTGSKPADVYCCKSEPKVLKEVEARYPDEAERQGIEGSVKLSVEIDEQGHVRKVKVIKGLGFGLDEAAVDALKRFQFAPAIASDGKPAAKTITYTYTFVIP